MTRTAFAALALVGAGLLVVADFSTLYEVEVGSLNTVLRTVPGHENHAYALVVVGVAAAIMSVGAWRGARPAAGALVVLGAVALGVALGLDLPDTSGSGKLSESVTFEDAQASAGVGFYLELLGGVVLVAAGGVLWAGGRERS